MMSTSFHFLKLTAIGTLTALMLAGAPSSSHAQIGSVHLYLSKAGFIVGVGGGSGTLSYGGKNYPLRVGGISVGTFGLTRADLLGRAYNLRSARDIAGTYTAVGAGVAIAGGAKTARLQNSNGVVIQLRGRQLGFEFSIDLSGMTVAMR